MTKCESEIPDQEYLESSTHSLWGKIPIVAATAIVRTTDATRRVEDKRYLDFLY